MTRPLRYSINFTLDGCCDHRAIPADEELHRHAVENLGRADALLFGRVTYEMMETAWRSSTRTVAMPDWTEPFARTIDAARKYVVSSTLNRVDWNAELVRGDLGEAVRRLKQEPGKGLFTGGVRLPLALAITLVEPRWSLNSQVSVPFLRSEVPLWGKHGNAGCTCKVIFIDLLGQPSTRFS